MIAGGLTVVLWIIFLADVTGIYELLPGFIVGMLACIIGTKLDKSENTDAKEDVFGVTVNENNAKPYSRTYKSP